MLSTWQNGDTLFKGDFIKALGAIKAKAIVMPASTDLYFPPEDNVFEVAHMPHAELRVVDTVWGHFAGGPGTSPADIESERVMGLQRSKACLTIGCGHFQVLSGLRRPSRPEIPP